MAAFQSSHTSQQLTSTEVQQGSILWLGSYEDTVASFATHGQHGMPPVQNLKTREPADWRMFKHPIIVLARSVAKPDTIAFAYGTTFRGKGLRGDKRASHTPISSTVDHPFYLAGDTRYVTLRLRNGDSMRKPGWVHVDRVFIMCWRDAQLYWGSDPTVRESFRLDESSIRALTRLTSLRSGIPITLQPTFSTAMSIAQVPHRISSGPAASHLRSEFSRLVHGTRDTGTTLSQSDRFSSVLANDNGIPGFASSAYSKAPRLETPATALTECVERERLSLLPHNEPVSYHTRTTARKGNGVVTWLAIGLVMVGFAVFITVAAMWGLT